MCSQTCRKRLLKGLNNCEPRKTGGLLTQVDYSEKCTSGVEGLRCSMTQVVLTLLVLVTTIDALQHFETG